MPERILKPGTRILFGAPANPMPAILADAIGQAVAQVPGIREAYLPQCHIEGDAEARQVLVVGFAKASQIDAALEPLFKKMRLVLPAGQFIDILPYTTSTIPPGAKFKECLIFKAKDDAKPWWKFWG